MYHEIYYWQYYCVTAMFVWCIMRYITDNTTVWPLCLYDVSWDILLMILPLPLLLLQCCYSTRLLCSKHNLKLQSEIMTWKIYSAKNQNVQTLTWNAAKKQIVGWVALKVLPEPHSFSGDVREKKWEGWEGRRVGQRESDPQLHSREKKYGKKEEEGITKKEGVERSSSSVEA